MKDVTGNTTNELAVGADPLTELLRHGAQDLITQAVEAELEALLASQKGTVLTDGRQIKSKKCCKFTSPKSAFLRHHDHL